MFKIVNRLNSDLTTSYEVWKEFEEPKNKRKAPTKTLWSYLVTVKTEEAAREYIKEYKKVTPDILID